jgi:multidrug efflux pump subunit AcrA (membrane-fusion protein)
MTKSAKRYPMYNYLKNSKKIIGVFLIWPLFGLATTHATELQNSFKTPISLSGIIAPANTLKVQSSVGGRVEILHVKENQHVSKGQLLLTLNNDTQNRQLELTHLQHKVNENNVRDRERQLKLANVQVKVNENNVKDRKKQLELAQIQIEVSRNNVKDLEANLKDILRRLKDEQTLFEQGSSTRSQLDVLHLQYSRGEFALKNTKLGLERSKHEISRAKINVDNTILNLERSREDIKGSKLGVENARLAVERSKHEVGLRESALEDTLIKAKIGGIITAKSFAEGEVISGGAVLFQIIDIKHVEIEIQVGEGDLPMIMEGQSVVFTTPSFRDKEFSGIIERISWTADPETGRFPLYVKAANPGLKLRAGMSAKVYLLWKN